MQVSFSLLCSALGISVALLKKGVGPKKRVRHAVEFSRMIEGFCFAARPELFEALKTNDNADEIDRQIEELKNNIRETGESRLPHDKVMLHQLGARLLERHQLYATEDHIANAALYFLEEEIRNDEGQDDFLDDDSDDPLCCAMEEAIVRIMKKKGECSQADLKAEGFPAGDVERLWARAYAFARVSLGWTDS